MAERAEVRVQLAAKVRGARRVVGRGDEDELRPRRDRGEDRVEVDPLVDQRHADGNGAELQRVEHVARERRPARDDLVAGVERRLADVADDRVGAGADGHLLEATSWRSASAAEPPRAAVGVAVELERSRGRSPPARRERAVRPLVRRELDDALEAELARTSSTGFPGSWRTARERGRISDASSPPCDSLTWPERAPGR